MGYYELRLKQNKVIRHFVQGNDDFVNLKPSNQEWEVAVLQPTPMKLSMLFRLQFKYDRPRQHTTIILTVHIVLSAVQ